MSVKFYYISILEPSFLRELINFTKKQVKRFVMLDLSAVTSEVQVMAAIERAERRMDHQSRIRDFGALVMMYVSGEYQIGRAIDAAGVKKSTKFALIVCEESSQVKSLVEAFPEGMEMIDSAKLPYDDPSKDRDVFFAMSNVDFQI